MTADDHGNAARPAVLKTWKMYVGGAFVRSESGRTYAPSGARGGAAAPRVCQASRKDLRDAVGAAIPGRARWHGRDAYNRAQIVYRIAEMLETRKAALADEIVACTDLDTGAALAEVEAAVDLTVWHAGLCDKLQSLLGSQNAVSGPFFNFSTVEPTGVIAVVAPSAPSLLGLLALVLPPLVGGNAVIALGSEAHPLPALAFGEVCASSDVPAGAVQVLSGRRDELLPEMAKHRGIDGLCYAGEPEPEIGRLAAGSVQRVAACPLPAEAYADPRAVRRLDWVEPFVEVKTFWHPVAP